MINYVDFRYSKAKGETEAGQVFNSALNMGPSDKLYTSSLVKDEVIGTGNGSTTQFSNIALPWYPVIPKSFLVECDGVIGVADESGAITGTGVSGTISAGRVVDLTFTTAPADGAEIVVTYNFDNESVNSDGPEAAGFTNVPEFELKINTMPVQAKARTLRTYWAFDAQYELQKEYGTDIEALLATQAAGEIAHEIDTELTQDLLNFANAAAPLTWSRTMIPGTSSLVDHYESFIITLNEGKNRIQKATRKKKGNFLICGMEVATVLESCRTFKPSNIQADGPHYIGEVAGLKCYVSPDYPDNEFVIGYKGNNMFEAGAFYCPYMPLSSTSVIMDANFRGQEAWATMYGKALLNSQLYIKGAITD